MSLTLAGATALAGGASALGGIISSIFGKRSNDSANATNMKIAQMNNEWSERMMNKQNQMNIAQWMREAQFAEKQAQSANSFTEYMQDKANEYNSAKNQAARLREAGLNPSIVMGGNNAGTAQGASGAQASIPSGNSVGLPSPTSAQVRPYDYSGFGRAITDAIVTSLQVQKMAAENTNMNLQNEFLHKSMENRLAQEYEKQRSQKYDTDFKQINESVRVSLENEQYLSTLTNRLIGEQQEKLVQQQRIYQELVNKRIDEKLSEEIAVMVSQRNLNEFNSSVGIGKFIDELKKRGFKMNNSVEKTIFGVLATLYAISKTK